jgi:hypothetical protein
MSVIQQPSGLFERQLKAYEESWLEARAAILRTDSASTSLARAALEEFLVLGVRLLDSLRESLEAWRTRVLKGEETGEQDEAKKEQFARWLQVCSTILTELDRWQEESNGLSRAAEFRHRCRVARQILESWLPPGQPRSELRRLPRERRQAILAAAAELAEEEYRTDPALTAFEAFGEEELDGNDADAL